MIFNLNTWLEGISDLFEEHGVYITDIDITMSHSMEQVIGQRVPIKGNLQTSGRMKVLCDDRHQLDFLNDPSSLELYELAITNYEHHIDHAVFSSRYYTMQEITIDFEQLAPRYEWTEL